MNEKDFLQQLLSFKKDDIPEQVITRIRKEFLSDPDFKPGRVRKASFAAKGLCEWIIKLEQYDKIAKLVAPKKAAAKAAHAKFSMTKKLL